MGDTKIPASTTPPVKPPKTGGTKTPAETPAVPSFIAEDRSECVGQGGDFSWHTEGDTYVSTCDLSGVPGQSAEDTYTPSQQAAAPAPTPPAASNADVAVSTPAPAAPAYHMPSSEELLNGIRNADNQQQLSDAIIRYNHFMDPAHEHGPVQLGDLTSEAREAAQAAIASWSTHTMPTITIQGTPGQ